MTSSPRKKVAPSSGATASTTANGENFLPRHPLLVQDSVLGKLHAFLCLWASLFFYWPWALLKDFSRGSRLGEWIHGPHGPGIDHPQLDADGPEYVVGTPHRRLFLYNANKTGHRGFLQSVLGSSLGGWLDSIIEQVWTLPVLQPVPRSKNDVSTEEDTLLLTGRVLDRATGKPVQGAVLRAWQSDPRGPIEGLSKYGDWDLDWDFRGIFEANRATGAYAVASFYPVTICGARSASAGYLLNALFGFLPAIGMLLYGKLVGKPSYDIRRPPHIHFYVDAPGYKRLVTQLYFLDRLAPGEFDDILKTDPAHPTAAMPLRDSLKLHPTRNSDAKGAADRPEGLPDARWHVAFDFTLDRV